MSILKTGVIKMCQFVKIMEFWDMDDRREPRTTRTNNEQGKVLCNKCCVSNINNY